MVPFCFFVVVFLIYFFVMMHVVHLQPFKDYSAQRELRGLSRLVVNQL